MVLRSGAMRSPPPSYRTCPPPSFPRPFSVTPAPKIRHCRAPPRQSRRAQHQAPSHLRRCVPLPVRLFGSVRDCSGLVGFVRLCSGCPGPVSDCSLSGRGDFRVVGSRSGLFRFVRLCSGWTGPVSGCSLSGRGDFAWSGLGRGCTGLFGSVRGVRGRCRTAPYLVGVIPRGRVCSDLFRFGRICSALFGVFGADGGGHW